MELVSYKPLGTDEEKGRIWGLEIENFDPEHQWKDLEYLLDKYLVLIFKGNYDFDEIKLQEFLSHFGKVAMQYPHNDRTVKMGDPQACLDSYSFLGWHNDGAFRKKPFSFSTLYARNVDKGKISGTYFCNLEWAYNDLPEDVKERLEKCRVEHSMQAHVENGPEKYIYEFRSDKEKEVMLKRARATHDLVQEHKGRKYLFFSDYIGGMDPLMFIWLQDHCYQDKYVIKHEWETGDIVISNNYMTAHKRDETCNTVTREMWKTQIV